MTMIKLTKEQIDFIKSHANHLCADEDWYYMPFWIKRIDDEGNFEIVSFDNLPNHVKEAIANMRSSPFTPQSENS